MSREIAIGFACGECNLIGILHVPDASQERGMLIVTGGPQYRVGSHRQFVLLARRLADKGFPVMRFDYRGMGDSDGEARNFLAIEDDLNAAIRQFFLSVPFMRELVLWGLCDGATASALHATKDARIRGLVLLNPWVRTEQGASRTTLRHYYPARLRDRAFWRKLLEGKFQLRPALASLAQVCVRTLRPTPAELGLPQMLYHAMSAFQGRMLLILSGQDFTAREFTALSANPDWSVLLSDARVRQVVLPQANHTFSRAAWRDEVAVLCEEWLRSW